MTLKIRRMREDDVETVAHLEREIFPDPWSADSFYHEVANTKLSYPCVLTKDSIILAYAVVWFYAGELHIGNLAVRPSRQKQGLGGRLLQHILDRFSQAEVAYLEVRKSNKPAIRLYEKFGFIPLTVRKGYYSNGEDAIVMFKKCTK
ncbi:MAG TPA: ribosomal-protein-alanine N-acetyltransferase [Caldithrix abyssi]|uniref:[Ribosomal protein bS18]-alanine N-acetyltransferase n=1 Tax=Caldithrix abyssi TaxID=187145 RepID=A0A7V4WUI6_CALAY|nr:ribosomal-protein-alanine N-acetyltransferase [Caldithrix abyssi]